MGEDILTRKKVYYRELPNGRLIINGSPEALDELHQYEAFAAMKERKLQEILQLVPPALHGNPETQSIRRAFTGGQKEKDAIAPYLEEIRKNPTDTLRAVQKITLAQILNAPNIDSSFLQLKNGTIRIKSDNLDAIQLVGGLLRKESGFVMLSESSNKDKEISKWNGKKPTYSICVTHENPEELKHLLMLLEKNNIRKSTATNKYQGKEEWLEEALGKAKATTQDLDAIIAQELLNTPIIQSQQTAQQSDSPKPLTPPTPEPKKSGFGWGWKKTLTTIGAAVVGLGALFSNCRQQEKLEKPEPAAAVVIPKEPDTNAAIDSLMNRFWDQKPFEFKPSADGSKRLRTAEDLKAEVIKLYGEDIKRWGSEYAAGETKTRGGYKPTSLEDYLSYKLTEATHLDKSKTGWWHQVGGDHPTAHSKPQGRGGR